MYDEDDDPMPVVSINDAQGLTTDLTWGELKRLAKGVPNDAKVILSMDAEGNAYHPLREVGPKAFFIADPNGAEHEVSGKPNGTPCIVLWPAD